MKKLSKIRGFTLVELITIMVIMGVLGAIAAPQFFVRNTFDSRGFYDQTSSTLRHAQKIAIAQRRFVCVAFTASTITLTLGASGLCGTPLTSPDGVAPYVVTAPNGVLLSGFADFNFNALGQPSAAQSITVSGYALTVDVAAVTGYVR